MARIQEITGHIRPIALANAVHQGACSSSNVAWYNTLDRIRECIAEGDRWFEEVTDDGDFRISTESGWSAIVKNRLAFHSAPLIPA